MNVCVYSVSGDGASVRFSLDLADFSLPEEITPATVVKITVAASFTLWRKNEAFEMTRTAGQGGGELWLLEKPVSEVSAPGNIGFPEFNFLVEYAAADGESEIFTVTSKTPLSDAFRAAGGEPSEEVFGDNFVILLDKRNLPALKGEAEKLLSIKKLSDYNLDSSSDRARISNVRKVPGTKNLWRGYHPYKKSRPNFDTEDTRISLVNEALERNNIRSIITLSGDEPLSGEFGETISSYVRNIQKNHNELFIDTSYETVYFQPRTKEHSDNIQKIGRFIITHDSPFYIHCRLGSDRTGTMSSILAALCGATWAEIAEDYELTSKAGFGEFRSSRLLEYSFSQLLGKQASTCADLQKELVSYLTESGILSEGEIKQIQKKLTE